MSQITKRYRIVGAILSFLSFLLVFGPFIGYGIAGLATATTAAQCAFLSCVGVATAISGVCIINKYTPRSRIFIFIFGLYFVIEHFLPCLIVIGACCMADEFIVAPLAKYYKNKYRINKEIDKRQ